VRQYKGAAYPAYKPATSVAPRPAAAPGVNALVNPSLETADALTTADRVTFFRMMAGEIARKHGYFASFMAKPFADRTGSGAHFNMSLADIDTGANLFAEGEDTKGVGVWAIGYSSSPACCGTRRRSARSSPRR
jgi:hypothetical protein